MAGTPVPLEPFRRAPRPVADILGSATSPTTICPPRLLHGLRAPGSAERNAAGSSAGAATATASTTHRGARSDPSGAGRIAALAVTPPLDASHPGGCRLARTWPWTTARRCSTRAPPRASDPRLPEAAPLRTPARCPLAGRRALPVQPAAPGQSGGPHSLARVRGRPELREGRGTGGRVGGSTCGHPRRQAAGQRSGAAGPGRISFSRSAAGFPSRSCSWSSSCTHRFRTARRERAACQWSHRHPAGWLGLHRRPLRRGRPLRRAAEATELRLPRRTRRWSARRGVQLRAAPTDMPDVPQRAVAGERTTHLPPCRAVKPAPTGSLARSYAIWAGR